MSSDLFVETLRLIKLRTITRPIRDPSLRTALSEQVLESLLLEDEEDCYNSLLEEIDLDNRWGPLQDEEYEKRMWQQWTRRPISNGRGGNK